MEMTASKNIGREIERQQKQRMKEIGDRLRQARQARQLSQGQVAEACAVTSQSISNWENGTFLADDVRLERAAARLGVSVEWLKSGDASKAPTLSPGKDLRGRPPTRNKDDNNDTAVRLSYDDAIPLMKNAIGSGGEYTAKAGINGHLSLPPVMLQHIKSDKLTVFYVLDDNLATQIKQGSFVVIDSNQVTPRDQKIFAIDNGLGLMLKRLTVNDSDLSQIGLSDEYTKTPTMVRRAKLKIVGRVVAQFDYL